MERMLLRPDEVAELLGICRNRTYQLLAHNKLPGIVRLGRSVRVCRKTLEQWVEQEAGKNNGGGDCA